MAPFLSMHEVVRSNLHTRLLNSLRLSSLAGEGLPERMRSTAFAFLGLTAAVGLTLVAIFAHLSFPLLAPAPLPSEPTEQNRIAEAVALDHSPGAFVPARPRGEEAASQNSNTGGDQGASGPSATPGGSAPGDGGSPASAPGSGGGGVPPEPVDIPSQDPAPASSPDPAQPPESVPVASPKPTTPARPAAPEPAPAPGNSQSSAAAEHASERGIEASTKSSAASSPGASSAPPPEAAPGNGNGKALGHSK